MSDLDNDVDPTQPEPLPTAPRSGAVPLPEDGPQDDLPQDPGSAVTGDADDDQDDDQADGQADGQADAAGQGAGDE